MEEEEEETNEWRAKNEERKERMSRQDLGFAVNGKGGRGGTRLIIIIIRHIVCAPFLLFRRVAGVNFPKQGDKKLLMPPPPPPPFLIHKLFFCVHREKKKRGGQKGVVSEQWAEREGEGEKTLTRRKCR